MRCVKRTGVGRSRCRCTGSMVAVVYLHAPATSQRHCGKLCGAIVPSRAVLLALAPKSQTRGKKSRAKQRFAIHMTNCGGPRHDLEHQLGAEKKPQVCKPKGFWVLLASASDPILLLLPCRNQHPPTADDVVLRLRSLIHHLIATVIDPVCPEWWLEGTRSMAPRRGVSHGFLAFRSQRLPCSRNAIQ